MHTRVFASDLPADSRWPYFVTAVQLEALLALVMSREYDETMVNQALIKPKSDKTQNAKRLYWEVPEDTIMIRLTNAERHALRAAAAGIARDAIINSEEIQGLKLHLQSRARKFRKAVRAR